jgi:hypothetical protein
LGILGSGPEPRPYRRIRREGALLRIAVGEWRAWYALAGRSVRVSRIDTGYRARDIAEGRAPPVHAAFVREQARGRF